MKNAVRLTHSDLARQIHIAAQQLAIQLNFEFLFFHFNHQMLILAGLSDELSTLSFDKHGSELSNHALISKHDTETETGLEKINLPVKCADINAGQISIYVKSQQNNAVTTLAQTNVNLTQFVDNIAHLLEKSIEQGIQPEQEKHRYLWVGQSLALHNTQKLITKFAQVDLPILIHGERGTGKQLAAYAIHRRSHRHNGPFTESCCTKWSTQHIIERVDTLIQKTTNGTLFLKNINVLPERYLVGLRHLWERDYLASRIPVRIICSTSPDFEIDHIQQSGATWLTMSLPTLHERQQDIRPLVDMLLEKYASITKLQFSDTALSLLASHQWKHNVKSLEHTIANICVKSDKTLVDADLLRQLIPELRNTEIKPAKSSQPYTDLSNDNETNPELTLAKKIIDKKLEGLCYPHPALVRSLHYIAENYDQKISLQQLAESAFVSPTHLSFLYRKHLGIAFKKLLAYIRIERSMFLLKTDISKSITQISIEIGFHDLSHFEKTFKKLTGKRPLQFRRAHLL